jgi:2-oxoisovalerate dehydrogenase E1 component alpha subunit
MARRAPEETSSHVVARFEVRRVAYVDREGKAVAELPAFARDASELVAMYRAMVLTRTFDAKAVALQRTGRLGTYASSLGQEAVAVGVGAAMRAEDVLVPSFREHGAQIWRGVTLVELLLFWGGDERGSDVAGPRGDFPVSIPIGSHAPHAAGAALALQLRGEKRAVVCVLGDGATSKGDFYEALNVAGVWKLPVVFVVNNNQWAISVPRERQSAAQTLAQKAIAGGLDGVQVDGNDVVAVREAVERALEKAREGVGPSVVECETYRLGDHTTADDATRYRDAAEVSARWKEEPVLRLRKYLVASGAWDKDRELAMLGDCSRTVEEAAAAYLAYPPAAPTDMFDYLFETLPAALIPERRAVAGEGDADA